MWWVTASGICPPGSARDAAIDCGRCRSSLHARDLSGLREAREQRPDAGSSCRPTPSDACSVAQSYSPVPKRTSFGETCHEFQGLAWRPWGLLPPPTPTSRHVCVPDSGNPLLSVSPTEQHPGQHRRASGHTTRPVTSPSPTPPARGTTGRSATSRCFELTSAEHSGLLGRRCCVTIAHPPCLHL